MKNLKFRAWDKRTKLMNDVTTIDLEQEIVFYHNWKYGHSKAIPFSDVILLQSTGLKDKNGVEIFEGDIVKYVNGELGYIAFLKQEMGYVIVYKNRDRRLGHRKGIDDFHLETIGNIYEHPHLLKE